MSLVGGMRRGRFGTRSNDERFDVINCNFSGVKRVLCLGAHSDDIEIGCGGTVLSLIAQSEKIESYWVVLGSNPQRAKEAALSANAFLRGARKKTVAIKAVREGFLPYIAAPVTECVEEIK